MKPSSRKTTRIKAMHQTQYLGTTILALILSATSALAHPGHSMGGSDVVHLLTSSYHIAVLALAGAGLMLGGTLLQRRVPRAILRCSGTVALASAALIWSMNA